jgi:hypothetical protein
MNEKGVLFPMIDVIFFLIFRLIFYNYIAVSPSNTSPATSHSARAPVDVSLEVSSGSGLVNHEIAKLR